MKIMAETEIPGGIIAVDLARGRSPGVYWLKAIGRQLLIGSYFSSSGVSRDIVVLDPSRSKVLFREGPYDGITVDRKLEKVTDEIRGQGLDQFLRSRQIANSQVGPVTAPSGYIGLRQWLAPYWQTLRRGIT
jgi:hypothetical protein